MTQDREELKRVATAIGPVEWHPGHLCRDDMECNCAYVFDDGHAGAICTVHVDNGLSISEGGNDAPSLELAKLHQAYIAAANPATVLSLLSDLEAMQEAAKSANDLRVECFKALLNDAHVMVAPGEEPDAIRRLATRAKAMQEENGRLKARLEFWEPRPVYARRVSKEPEA